MAERQSDSHNVSGHVQDLCNLSFFVHALSSSSELADYFMSHIQYSAIDLYRKSCEDLPLFALSSFLKEQ